MKRRDFLSLLGVSTAWPLAARAQQAGKVARIGFLGAATAAGYANQLAGFRQGLRDLGYVEGTNIIIEFRWAEGNYERLPALVADLIRANVDVIVTHGTPGSLAVKQATATIPIVMAVVADPVAMGLVAGVARPGSNLTGLSSFSPEIQAKRLELLKEVMPRMTRVAFLLNSDNPVSTGPVLQAMEMAAKSLMVRLEQFPVRRPSDFESAFERIGERGIDGVAIDDEPMTIANMKALAALAMRHRLLSIGNREFAQDGGLIGYGVDFVAIFRRAAVFVDKILKGTKPADLPIEQATRFEFVLNLKTAKALGLDLPTATLLRADEVIE
jgi:putative ABC transport system substrate-binding protein